jgi:hypothetical protein
MNTREYDQTTTIAITIYNRNRLEKLKLVPEQSWNSVIERLLDRLDEEVSTVEASKRTVEKK